ncbi:unnamed protein product [Angiostrongylus costaricensis]|uniref:Charged multivesicular body protein 5 n=1 Tax=Angiostrongylus costaricensis TaxID=334426 RepID=A0A0R3PJW0_ANGCS|nr:unnamed protein product [Angiostrongylus costaricensis]
MPFQFEDLKRVLVKSKEDLEFAKEDMKNGETPARKKALKKANQKYEIQMKALDDFITGKLADLKNEHVKEIEMIITEAQLTGVQLVVVACVNCIQPTSPKHMTREEENPIAKL